MKFGNGTEPKAAGDSYAVELQGRPLWDPGRPGPELLEALREEIAANGMPGADRLREIAVEHNTTAAKVRGVIGYYSDLSKDSLSIKVCMGEACRARGAGRIGGGRREADLHFQRQGPLDQGYDHRLQRQGESILNSVWPSGSGLDSGRGLRHTARTIESLSLCRHTRSKKPVPTSSSGYCRLALA